MNQKKQKFALKLEGYGWSKKFDITTFGVSGLATLSKSKRFDNNDRFI
jgi:hypothetical protein